MRSAGPRCRVEIDRLILRGTSVGDVVVGNFRVTGVLLECGVACRRGDKAKRDLQTTRQSLESYNNDITYQNVPLKSFGRSGPATAGPADAIYFGFAVPPAVWGNVLFTPASTCVSGT